MSSETAEHVPQPGQWPVDPQDDVPIGEDRIWIDGCFDFSHHGHAGAMLQARQLGTELLVGVHSDEAILENKGPTVMTLKERTAAVDACRWATKSIPHAPYVTSLPWISHYGCKYVVHGDDITSDASGEDCYRFVKAAGRFKIVKRTPGISTTDLVGRMLLCTKGHFIKNLEKVLAGEEGSGSEEERKRTGAEMKERIRAYATDASGLAPGSEVWVWHGEQDKAAEPSAANGTGKCTKMVAGTAPRKGQRIVYVDGGFDLFSSGHIEFLRQVAILEEEEGKKRDWYSSEAVQQRITESGADYSPVYVVAGVHDDEVINHWKGINYPIMNIFERGLCVLQCKYINAVVFSAPFTPTPAFLNSLPYGTPDTVYHGPTAFMPSVEDPYVDAKTLNIFREVPAHEFQHVNAGEIVDRIMASRALYEERQRKKGVKGAGEEAIKRREEMEKEARAKEAEREAERERRS
ncbi:putative phosphoethanolamine protein [Neofusicoccum parvum UCRNP2]|uniref:ethanolamine-phosphate cytidylyltransferase n=1 Tax=Botryosphaeria parva (strain UCR-NP2) TaxID=1287680 RepID=R1GGL0_BOTPV|nr:putative phosphoethanolamine protein [Neofusicoccum parvum UCRNP2]